ncbi:MAG TPA: DUF5667 domain-containing protein [Candidatus Paceibacterota bacterium]
MKFFTSKSKKLPAAAQKGLLPRKEFMTQGKERFLAAFDASALGANAHSAYARPSYVTTFFKIGIGALAALCIAVGLSAYADTANVSATSPLYSLKRIGENVQLAFASPVQKSQLQATFAVRRANEIAALQTSAPSSTLIPQLTSDLDQDIDTSLSAFTNATSSGSGGNSTSSVQVGTQLSNAYYRGGSQSTTTGSSTVGAITASSSVDIGSIDVYCNAFNVSTSGVLIGQLEVTLAKRPNGFAEFNEQCRDNARDQRNGTASSTGETSNDQDHHNRHPMGGYITDGSATATSSITTGTITTTIIPTPTTTKVSGVASTTVTITGPSTPVIHINTPQVGL